MHACLALDQSGSWKSRKRFQRGHCFSIKALNWQTIVVARKNVPGTIDFMRTKIKHVVYYMLENRSFDHICGWLYEKGEEGINVVGGGGPFQGLKHDLAHHSNGP